MKDFTYGLLGTEHVWTDEGGIALGILSCLHNLYVSITQTLDNIKLRCNHGLQTFRTIRQKKKRWNSITQFVFCRCLIRFFSQLCKKKLEIDLAEGFQMIHVNGRRHCFFLESHVNFLGKPWKCSWHIAISARKVDF